MARILERVGEAQDGAEGAEGGLGAVEHPHLEEFVPVDMVDELRPGQVPWRPRPGETILDHPLPERLARDAGEVRHADGVSHMRPIGPGHRGHDPVHHRRREGHDLVDPAGQFSGALRRDGADRTPENGPVGRDVVATQHRERRTDTG